MDSTLQASVIAAIESGPSCVAMGNNCDLFLLTLSVSVHVFVCCLSMGLSM